MERAGRAVAWAVRRECSAAPTARGSSSSAARATTAATGWSRRGCCAAGASGSTCSSSSDGIDRPALRAALGRADVVVDAMYGTGFRGALEGDAALGRACDRGGARRRASRSTSRPASTARTGAARGDAVRAVPHGHVRGAASRASASSRAARTPVTSRSPTSGSTLGVDRADASRRVGVAEASTSRWRAAARRPTRTSGRSGAARRRRLGRDDRRAADGEPRGDARRRRHRVVRRARARRRGRAASGTEVITQRAARRPPTARSTTRGRRRVLDALDAVPRASSSGPGSDRDERPRAAVRRLVARRAGRRSCSTPTGSTPSPATWRRCARATAPDRPHPARGRVRAARSASPSATTASPPPAGSPTATRRRRAAEGPGHGRGAAPDGRVAINPTGGPVARHRRARATCSPGIVGGLLARGVEPFAAAAARRVRCMAGRRDVAGHTGLVAGDLIAALPRTLVDSTELETVMPSQATPVSERDDDRRRHAAARPDGRRRRPTCSPGRSIGAAPVVDDDGKVVGLLRDEDLIVSEARLHVPTVITLPRRRLRAAVGAAQALRGRARAKAAGATVGDVMATEFPTVGARRHASRTLATLMHDTRRHARARRRRRRKLVGIVARGDLSGVPVARRRERRARTGATAWARGRPRRGPRQRPRRCVGRRRARPRVHGGREGRRVRPRRGPRGRVPRSTPAPRGSASRSSRRASSSASAGHRRARPRCSRSRRRTRPRRSSQHDLTPIVYTARRHRRAGEGGRRRGPARTAARPPQGRHRHAPRRVRVRRGASPSPSSSRHRAELALEGVCTHLAVADEPDNPYTAEQLDRVRRRARRRSARAGVAPRRSCTRPTRPACSRTPTGLATTSCASASPSTASRRRRTLAGRVAAPPGAVAQGAGVAREGARRRRPPLLRPALRAAARRRPSRRCRSATPTACPATWRTPAARCSSAGAAARSPAPSRWTS